MNRREFVKKSLGGIVVGSIPYIGCSKNPVKYPVDIDFDTISKGYSSDIEEEKSFVINNDAEWNKMWKEAFERQFSAPPSVPNTDFLENTVLAVYMGERPTTGYEINISDITESNNAIFVKVSEKTPQGGTGLAFTQPYHIVKVAKFKKPVIFK